jgi:hypothetical protein
MEMGVGPMKKMILLIAILFLMTPMVAGCAKVESRLVPYGDGLKYDSLNGLIYERNEKDVWEPTGRRIFWEGNFQGKQQRGNK